MTTDDHDVLERNVSTLLETGGERPQIAEPARARIRAELVGRYGAVHRRSPLVAVGLGLAAMVAAALIIGRFVGSAGSLPPASPMGRVTAVAGAEVITEPGGKLTELGARHVRVEGAALIDVAPGNGAFVVETAHGRIEVLGTRFVVDAEPGKTTAAVVRGEVKLATPDGDVVLHAGEQAVAEPGRPPVRGPAPRLSHLVSWAREARHRDERATEPVHHGTLFARDPGVRSHPPWGPEYPLPIARLGLDVVVEDQVARVALDQTFHNAADQALEGVYRFAIPPDAALSRLAMYVDGKLTESGVVERMAARRIYEELVYRRVDPALLEWAGTGRLALRVYPIPARQDKRLMVAYTQSLPELYGDWTLAIPLPEVDQPVGVLDVAVRVKGCAGCELSSTSHRIEVARDGGDAIVRYHRAGETIGDSFVLHVRDPRAGVTVAEARRGGERYLLVRAPGELAGGPVRYRPRTWVLLDDVSASRSRMERRAQADVIDAFLRELDEQDRVAVVAFDVGARTRLPPTRVVDVDRRALRRALDAEGGVGATDLAVGLDAAMTQLAGVDPDAAMIVYLGDGVVTSGARNLDALRARIAGKAQFVGVGIGDGPDTQTLQGLASATGGYATTIDLADDLGWRAFDLVAALHTARVTGLDARLVDAAGQLVPSTSYLASPELADGEQLELVGKLAGGGTPAAVELTGTLDGQPWHRTISLTGSVTASGSDTASGSVTGSDTASGSVTGSVTASDSATGSVSVSGSRTGSPAGAPVALDRDAGYLPRLWAQRHIAARLLAKHEPVVVPPCDPSAGPRGKPVVCPTEAELREQRDEAIRKEVVGLGKQYFLLSRHTSLLVLENDEMYARYGVTRGAGDTWAPYAMPAKIPVVVAAPPVVPANIAGDAELIRAPLPVFYEAGGGGEHYRTAGSDDTSGFAQGSKGEGNVEGNFVGAPESREAPVATVTISTAPPGITMFAPTSPSASTRGDLPLTLSEGHAGKVLDHIAPERAEAVVETKAEPKAEKTAAFDPFGPDEPVERARRRSVVAAAGGLIADLEAGPAWPAWPASPAWGGGKAGGGRWGRAQPIAPHLTYPTDPGFDDVTGFVPALVPDAADRWRGQLEAGGDAPHVIDDAARALLAAARRALPTGVYRWAGVELAVDGARRIGWRRTSDAGLAETASFDGTTWTRRYAELGLDVTRVVRDDDVALGLGYLPVWIAEPAHYARWFDVTARGAHEVVLSRRVRGSARIALILRFDDQARLVAISGGAGEPLVEVQWDAGPTSARVRGDAIAVGFTGQPVSDAVQWAQRDAAPGLAVELPAHLPAYWQDRLRAETAGSPTWRHAERQLMVALAAIRDRAALWQAYDQLRTHGGVELGDLVLASGGVASNTRDEQLAAALAPLAAQPVARYLIAGRAFGKSQRPERLRPDARDGVPEGLIRALWSLRAATAYLHAGNGRAAADQVIAIGDRAPELRLIGAAAMASQWSLAPGDIARAWDAAAAGAYRNVARAAAAQTLYDRGLYDAGVDRVVALIGDLDLQALPPRLDGVASWFNASRRGPAGWQMVWATWRDRALAGTSYDHVMALLSGPAQPSGDVTPILARAAQLAGHDGRRTLEVARAAIALGHVAWAEALLRPLVAPSPSSPSSSSASPASPSSSSSPASSSSSASPSSPFGHDLHQLVAFTLLQQGRLAEALTELEAAQDAGADDAVGIATVRSELAQIIDVARRLAVQSSGAAREQAVAHALAWGDRWRAIDPGNTEIDRRLGELMLAIGDAAGAWRQLSSTIERDPWSGAGYAVVADAFERQGKITEALVFWQQAIVIDQTDPTPRLRKAQALIALGRTAEGDALLSEIASRKWHDMWSTVVYQARELLERGKRSPR